MTLPTSTYVPEPSDIRYPIERVVLEYFLTDNITLKPDSQWPGYYTLKTGQKIPCIFAEGKDQVPSSWKPSGIQCIIEEVPEQSVTPGIGQIILVSTWKVIFTNYGFDDTTRQTATLKEVQSRMARLFPTANLRYNSGSDVALEALTVRFRGTSLNSILRPF